MQSLINGCTVFAGKENRRLMKIFIEIALNLLQSFVRYDNMYCSDAQMSFVEKQIYTTVFVEKTFVFLTKYILN